MTFIYRYLSGPGITSVLVFFPLLLWAATKVPGEIFLAPGEQQVLEYPSLQRVAVGNPKIANVKVLSDQRQVLLTAIGPGITNLIIWDREGNKATTSIRVDHRNNEKSLLEFQTLLGNIEGVGLRTVGERIVIEGQVLKEHDMEKIKTLQELYPQVVSFVEVNPMLRSVQVEHLNKKLKKMGVTTVRAISIGDTIFLEGQVHAQEEHDRALSIASSLVDNPRDLIHIGPAEHLMVHMNAKIVEINNASLKNLGINWQDTIEGFVQFDAATGSGKEFTWTSDMGTRISSTLNILMQKGKARLLANPQLVARSGEEAQFLVGGEIPIRVVNNNVADVIFKEFGIILMIKPEVRTDGSILAQITAEVSSIDEATSAEEIPGFRSRKITTSINVQEGETIILGGLMNREESKQVQKFPLLGHIPLLGEFFKNRNLQNARAELLIFVTPHLISPESPMNRGYIENIQKSYHEDKDIQKWKLTD